MSIFEIVIPAWLATGLVSVGIWSRRKLAGAVMTTKVMAYLVVSGPSYLISLIIRKRV